MEPSEYTAVGGLRIKDEIIIIEDEESMEDNEPMHKKLGKSRWDMPHPPAGDANKHVKNGTDTKTVSFVVMNEYESRMTALWPMANELSVLLALESIQLRYLREKFTSWLHLEQS